MLTCRLSLPFGRPELDHLQAKVREAARGLGLKPRVVAHLVFLIEEIGTNILQHSGANWMELTFEGNADRFALGFRDNGEEYNTVEALGYQDGPVLGEAIQRHLGLWMMSRLDFEPSYRRLDEKGGVNELVFHSPSPKKVP